MACASSDDSLEDLENKSLLYEASEAVREAKFAVDHIEISDVLPKSEALVYINLRTKEGRQFCVELTLKGFRIVCEAFDTVQDSEGSPYYETIQALLDSHSPLYRDMFGNALMDKLEELKEVQEDEDQS